MDGDKPIELWKYHARLRRDLAEQLQRSSVLIRDSHHRMANGLQVIASSASNQLRAAPTPEAAAFARRILARTQAIARVYRILLLGDGELDLASFLVELGADLEGLLTSERSVAIRTRAMPLNVPSAVAAPLMFIAHELVTNAVKHGLAGRPGTIDLRLSRAHLGHSALMVTDSGTGFPKGFRHKDGLGMVTKLAETIGGSIYIYFRSTRGAEVKVIFPTQTAPGSGTAA